MPNPSEYENQNDFMGACVPMMMDEGRDNEQAVGACMGMWNERKSFGNMTMEEAVKHFLKIGARNSRKDQERLQVMHDYAVENGAVCVKKSVDNALKTIAKTDEELRVGNYIALFGGRDLTGFAHGKNRDGSLGEFFTPQTDFESDYTKTGRIYVDFEHSFDPDGLGIGKDDILGYVDWKTAKKDERGLFVERVLNRRQKYVQWLEELIDAGLIGNSSEAIPSLVERKDTGEILRWGLRRDTLTVNPMEPRMLAGNHIQAIKALSEVMPELKSLLTSEAAVADKEAKSIAANAAKDKDMEKEEIKAMFDEQANTIKTLVQTESETAAKKAVDDVLDKLPEVKAKMNGTVTVTVDEADRPFRSIAEQMRAVKNEQVSQGRIRHPRLKFLEEIEKHEVPEPTEEKSIFTFKEVMASPLKAPQGMSEGVPSDSGYLLEPTLVGEIFKPIHDSGVFSQDARTLPVGGNSNYGWINGVDETSRVAGSRWGGVLGYHRAEAASVTATHPKFRRINWELKVIEVLMYATEEQLQDIAQTNAIVQQAASEELDFIVNDDIFTGNGVGKALGVMNSGPLISIARYATSQVNHDDLVGMWGRLSPRSRARAKWYINSDVEPQLDKLAFKSNLATTEMPSPYVRYSESGVFTIKGRPVVVTEFNQSLDTAGDILLADMSQYLRWEKGGVQASVNPWIQWLTSEQAFKFTYRCDGQTADASAMTPYHGSNTQSPFVALSASTS